MTKTIQPPKTKVAKFLDALGLRTPVLKLFGYQKQPGESLIDVAIQVVNGIKHLVESTAVVNFVMITKPTWDDKLISWVRKATIKALEVLSLVRDRDGYFGVPVNQQEHESLQSAVSFLKSVSKKDRGQLYDQLAGNIASELTGEVVESAIEKTRIAYEQSKNQLT